jgi:hypothetical protein
MPWLTVGLATWQCEMAELSTLATTAVCGWAGKGRARGRRRQWRFGGVGGRRGGGGAGEEWIGLTGKKVLRDEILGG